MKAISTVAVLAAALAPLGAETFQNVESEVRSRSGAQVRWETHVAAREKSFAAIAKLLRKPLTVASAVQIALLSNRELQAAFFEIGIAQADVLEAVTIPNPSVDFDVQFPVAASEMNRYGWLVAQEFVQILMAPLRKKIAAEQLEAAELRVAAQTLDLVAGVKTAYFTYQAGQQLLSRLERIQETNAAALDLAQKQFEAGNTTDLALLQAQAGYSQGRLDVARTEGDLRGEREKLSRLMGLWGAQTKWEIKGEILPAPDADLRTGRLESLAVSQRLDLRAAHRDLTILVAALGLTKTYRWIPVLDMGFGGEKDVDGALNMGPTFRIELPIFNQGQARIARGEAQLRMAESRFEALAVTIRSEVRELRDRLLSLAEMARHYHDDLLPLRIRMVNKALLQYNAMQLSPYDLFTTKSLELETERAYIDTLRDYWITRAELERAVGGTLTPRPAKPSQGGSKTPQTRKNTK